MNQLAADVEAFLRRSQVVQVATLSPKGRPFSTPLWFVVERGVIHLTTGAGSRAGKNVAVNPGVVLLFRGELERGPARCLRIRGTASLHHGMPSWPNLLRLAAKYYLPPRALWTELRNLGRWRVRQGYYAQAQGGPGTIRVVASTAEFLDVP